jgi:hypothetical protein
MGILKDILKTLFGKAKNNNEGCSVNDFKLSVVFKKQEAEKIGAYESLDDLSKKDNAQCVKSDESKHCDLQRFADDFREPVFTPAISVNPILPDDSVKSENKKKSNKCVVGKKTLSKVRDYLLTFGSVNLDALQKEFKVKSLRNFIWYLRKEGFNIKTEKIESLNELGQKIKTTNYILMSKNN